MIIIISVIYYRKIKYRYDFIYYCFYLNMNLFCLYFSYLFNTHFEDKKVVNKTKN